MARVHYDRGFRIRIEHGERAELRIVRDGRTIVIDPEQPIEPGDVVVLTGPGPDRIRATAAAVREGKCPTVVASEDILVWLQAIGPIDANTAPCTIDGVAFAAMPYTPPPFVRPPAREMVGALGALKPTAALRALRERSKLPTGAPFVWQLTLPDGGRLLHLDLALHRNTEASWVEKAVAAFGKPEWLILGSQYGETDGVVQWLGHFEGKRVMVAELVNGERRALGLPIELVTPLRDRLCEAGTHAHVFATQTSFRYE